MEREESAVIYRLEETLNTISETTFLEERCPAVIITNTHNARRWIHETGLSFEGTINLKGVEFCKVLPTHTCDRVVRHEFPEYAGAGTRLSGRNPAQYRYYHCDYLYF